LKKIASFDPTSPRQLNARIPQELETIVLKATEKNPADRYMSAQELALDLARFLDNRPVLAKRPSLATRLTKWSLRHRTIVSTVAASLLVALIASSVVFWNANRRIRSTLDTLQDKNDELRLANERSAKTLNLARQAIDDVYVEFANKWVGEQSDLSPLQRDFLVSAAEIYTELCTEFLNDYELLLRTIEAQVGAANITAYLGDPDKANGWFKQAFDSMDYLNATKPMEVGLLAMIARGKADYGHHNFFNWDGRHTKVSSKQWLNNEVLPAVYALADYLEQAPDDHYAIEALAYAQASLFSHSSGISDHDWAKLKGQINRNVDRLKTQHPSPQILSQLSDTLQKAMTLEQRMLRNRETGSEDLQRLIADAELAIELAQQAYETSPTREIQQRLAWAYSQKANIQRSTSLKLLPEAVEGYRKAIQHTSGLAQQFPSRVEYWNDLCGQYKVLSDTHHEMGLPSARPEWLEYHEAYCEQHLREGLSLEFPDVARDFALVFKSNILTSLATFHGRMNDAKQSFECVQQAQQMLSQVGENASVMRVMYINRPAVMEANLAVQPFIPFTFEQRKQMLFDAVARWKKNGHSNQHVWAYDPNVVATRSYRDRFMNFYAKNAKELDEETEVLNLEHVMVMGAAPEILEQAAALAKRALEKSSESDANLARLWWIYARVSYERGQFDEALAWYRKLEETKQLGLYQSTRFEMCMVLEHLGRSDEARAYFSAGLKHIEEVWAIVDRGTANMMCRAALLLDEEARIRDFLKERWLGELDEFFIENQ
jgi:hypothetical protein